MMGSPTGPGALVTGAIGGVVGAGMGALSMDWSGAFGEEGEKADAQQILDQAKAVSEGIGAIKKALEEMSNLDYMTIGQRMMKFAERVTERGGEALDPLEYKHEYLRRLEVRIQSRVERLASGDSEPVEHLLHGSIALLDSLRERGWNLYLASGTDEPFVKREAKLLGLGGYFGEHIYGAQDDYKSFSKKQVIERILRENEVEGDRLLVIGDGYVEIEDGKIVGGLAVAVASDEAHNGAGEFDEWKRKRLLGVGADIVVPDYRDADVLVDVIEGK